MKKILIAISLLIFATTGFANSSGIEDSPLYIAKYAPSSIYCELQGKTPVCNIGYLHFHFGYAHIADRNNFAGEFKFSGALYGNGVPLSFFYYGVKNSQNLAVIKADHPLWDPYLKMPGNSWVCKNELSFECVCHDSNVYNCPFYSSWESSER